LGRAPIDGRAKIISHAAQLLLERKSELAKLATLEMGKRIAESRGEVELSAAIRDISQTSMTPTWTIPSPWPSSDDSETTDKHASAQSDSSLSNQCLASSSHASLLPQKS
jgi:acyl-CoA reductase-like NAD-dependent aldehyde dehydrogenase